MKISSLLLILLSSLLAGAQSPSSVYVHFAFDKSILSQGTRATLDSLTDSLDVTDRIELHGHCDAVGANEYNDRLAERRVQAVLDYLLGLGWEKQDILIAKGYGENKPLNKNASAEERSLNRRVEIKILRGAAVKLPTTGQPVNKPAITESLTKKLADTSAVAGSNIILQNINFIGGMHQFLPESRPMLDELLDAMITYPTLVIRIEGHICCTQTPGDGPDLETGINNLSEARARAVRDFLVFQGIAPERVSYKGFGHSKPIYPYPEKSKEEETQNRRVEIKIISR